MPSRLVCLILFATLAAQLSPTPHPAHAAPQAPTTNLTLATGGRVTLELLYSESAWSNTLSVVAPTITTTLSGCTLQPAVKLGGVHILSEKLSQRGCRAELDANPTTTAIDPFPDNTTFEFGFCAQTDGDAECEYVWSSNRDNNADGFDHVRITPLFAADFPGRIYKLEWEDLPGGGDTDFNDLVAILRVVNDSDGDGLWDDWERFGIDVTGDGVIDLNLPAEGADPNRRDIFLEIDYMDCAVAGSTCALGDARNRRLKQDAVQSVIDAFAAHDITLHIVQDDPIPHQPYMTVGCGRLSSASFDNTKADARYFGRENPRRYAYHYAIVAHRQGEATTSAGCAETPGNDLVITLGDWNAWCIGSGENGVLNTPAAGDDVRIDGDTHGISAGPNLACNTTASGDDVQVVASGAQPQRDLDGDGEDDRDVGTVRQQAATLMHELGHNLGLAHGGGDEVNEKPNYLSVMNYAFPDGIPQTPLTGLQPTHWRIDYSSEDLENLNEFELNELDGIGSARTFVGLIDNTVFTCPNGSPGMGFAQGPIDWSCDGDGGTDFSSNVDIDNSGDLTAALAGFDDWRNLKLDFQNSRDFDDGTHTTPQFVIERSYAEYVETPGVVDVSAQYALTPSNGELVAGQQVQIAFDVANIGPVPAQGVTLISALPPGLALVGVAPDAGCTQHSRTLSCTLALLQTNAPTRFTLNLKADPTLPDGTQLRHTVTISQANSEANLLNNVISTTLTLVRESDLTITQTRDTSGAPFAGDPIRYQLEVRNIGQSIATGVVLSDVLPAGVMFDPVASSTDCAAAGGVVTCTLGTLLDHSSKRVVIAGHISTTLRAGGTLTNTALVRADGRDPAPADNTTAHTITLHGKVNLPLLFNQNAPPIPTGKPDLVVTAITLTERTVAVTIKNIGPGAVSSADEFWVDLYISPTVAPQDPNQTWQKLGGAGGLVWGIGSVALPLAPQAELTLHLNDPRFASAESRFPALIPAGAHIYAQVDSANAQTRYGGVLEAHEGDEGEGMAYNNISAITLSQAVSTAQWQQRPSQSTLAADVRITRP